MWTLQLGRTLESAESSASMMLDAISAQLSKVSNQYRDVARVGRYREVHLYDRFAKLSGSTHKRLDEILEENHPEMSWALMCATLFQRPLYVGKAINFRSRLRNHFDYKTAFSQKLRDHGASVLDCAVILCPLTREGMYEDDDSLDDAESPVHQNDKVENEDNTEEEYVPPGRESQDRLIRLAESVVIRACHPVFNDRMD
ncbi:GIY-YIG nuclease family protein [Actinokineospora spheciospongiae]|uniref:hypothetical protein n=1 Tax=Actinokineospora spheciospongiae TaxID=909613 RepID=UPI0015E83C3F|nr:hypothetical protein [Actinokineospora spheciospongiae]